MKSFWKPGQREELLYAFSYLVLMINIIFFFFLMNDPQIIYIDIWIWIGLHNPYLLFSANLQDLDGHNVQISTAADKKFRLRNYHKQWSLCLFTCVSWKINPHLFVEGDELKSVCLTTIWNITIPTSTQEVCEKLKSPET